ncbi:hypothetical protein [Lunatibacter salilacus]|uniref:hypothetical protein n=1 Tax=Lunatibacter salilacus TaxID=2483804 RepID=UPI00131E7DEC|nr:hypothetical protein [Lunatibacter salilacus]
MIRKLNIIVVFLLLIITSVSYGQKREIERAVNSSSVPEKARTWLEDTYEGHKRVRWYFQTDGEKEVYEAKLKWQGKWHSVEFLPDGQIQNIEILIKVRDLEKEVSQNLTSYLTENYQRFKIDRLQIQYTGSSGDLEELITENEAPRLLTKKYEIEYFGREDGQNKMWEGHFDKHGNFIEKRVIELSSTDVLDF